SYSISKPLNLSAGATLDADEGTTPVIIKEIQKTNSIDFPATGKKDVGEKAKGTISLSNTTESDPVFVAAGSRFTTATGLEFVSDSDVTVPGAKFVGGIAKPAGAASVSATASEIGEAYNVGPQSLVSNDITIAARFDQATSGGSKRQVIVVSSADIEKAKEQLKAQDANAIKAELKAEFDSTTVSIDESFTVTAAEPVVSPAVDQEASSGKLTAETKYLILGIAKDNLRKILEADINAQLEGLPNQKIYDSGVNKVRFNDFAANDGGAYSVELEATGYVGPNIDAKSLAEQASGKRSGEIQAQVQSIDGVESVDVNFSPFWVTSAPKADKITVKFLVKNETN
ncbi:MAG TPA: baseplate J/gp47 family protein, partial [Candidatus Nitrosotenuis sp.]|nr:baseplate J/gp47 family protein [Candidatus Nitrosotenuis sp.]